MSLIIIEGPEKAGKSTLAEALGVRLKQGGFTNTVIRHQVGRATPDDRIYLGQLLEDTATSSLESVAIWDRGWPSEYVYGNLLNQNRRLAKDPWLGEWEYGRRVAANGLKVMLPGPHYSVLNDLRTPDDLLVNCAAEQMLYFSYAFRFGWLVLEQKSLDWMVDIVINQFLKKDMVFRIPAQSYLGDPHAETIIVYGDHRKVSEDTGRLLGDRAMDVGWVTAHECSPVYLRNAKILVTLGKQAHSWVRDYVLEEGGSQQVIQLPSVSYLSILAS